MLDRQLCIMSCLLFCYKMNSRRALLIKDSNSYVKVKVLPHQAAHRAAPISVSFTLGHTSAIPVKVEHPELATVVG